MKILLNKACSEQLMPWGHFFQTRTSLHILRILWTKTHELHNQKTWSMWLITFLSLFFWAKVSQHCPFVLEREREPNFVV